MDSFFEKILEEFNQDLYRVMNITVGHYRRIFMDHGENVDIKFRAIFKIDGSTELRRYLKGCVGGLHYLFSKTADTGEDWMARPHDDEEMSDHIESLNLGIDRDGII